MALDRIGSAANTQFMLTQIQKAERSGAPPLSAFLACGFTPLHLQTFLAAHLSCRFPDRRIQLQVGLFVLLASLHGSSCGASGPA